MTDPKWVRTATTVAGKRLEAIVIEGARLGERTKVNYLRSVRDWLQFAGEDPKNWTSERAYAFYGEVCRRMPVASANGIIAGLKYVAKRYAHLFNDGRDFAAHLETQRGEPREVQEPLSGGDLRRMIDSCSGNRPADLRDYGLVYLGVTTGCRRAGIAGIDLVDFQPARGADYNTVVVTLKGGKRHAVPLLPGTMAILEYWRLWLRRNQITSGKFFRRMSVPNITGAPTIGDSLSAAGIYKILKSRAEAVGIKGFHPHTLRHVFITRCRDAGVPAHEIAAITGHAVGGTGMIDSVYANPIVIGASALESIRKLNVFGDLFR